MKIHNRIEISYGRDKLITDGDYIKLVLAIYKLNYNEIEN